MAAGFMRELAGDRIEVLSAGSRPASSVNPMAVKAMQEINIDITKQIPKRWTAKIARNADVIVSMGCGDECPVFPGTRRIDWPVDDPAGLGIEAVRPIRDKIHVLVDDLVAELTSPCC